MSGKRRVVLTEREASMVLSNWCVDGAAPVRLDVILDRRDLLGLYGADSLILDVLHAALHAGGHGGTRTRDRLAACISVVPRRVKRRGEP